MIFDAPRAARRAASPRGLLGEARGGDGDDEPMLIGNLVKHKMRRAARR
jgi:hypothetical protein